MSSLLDDAIGSALHISTVDDSLSQRKTCGSKNDHCMYGAMNLPPKMENSDVQALKIPYQIPESNKTVQHRASFQNCQNPANPEVLRTSEGC